MWHVFYFFLHRPYNRTRTYVLDPGTHMQGVRFVTVFSEDPVPKMFNSSGGFCVQSSIRSSCFLYQHSLFHCLSLCWAFGFVFIHQIRAAYLLSIQCSSLLNNNQTDASSLVLCVVWVQVGCREIVVYLESSLVVVFRGCVFGVVFLAKRRSGGAVVGVLVLFSVVQCVFLGC